MLYISVRSLFGVVIRVIANNNQSKPAWVSIYMRMILMNDVDGFCTIGIYYPSQRFENSKRVIFGVVS